MGAFGNKPYKKMLYNRITMSKFILSPVRFILPGLILLLLASQVKADWINLTGAQNAPNIAEIYVNNDHVKLILEISVNDIGSFKDLLPEELFLKKGLKVPPQAERLQHFASTIFQFVTENGKKLPARLKLFEPRQRQDGVGRQCHLHGGRHHRAGGNGSPVGLAFRSVRVPPEAEAHRSVPRSADDRLP